MQATRPSDCSEGSVRVALEFYLPAEALVRLCGVRLPDHVRVSEPLDLLHGDQRTTGEARIERRRNADSSWLPTGRTSDTYRFSYLQEYPGDCAKINPNKHSERM